MHFLVPTKVRPARMLLEAVITARRDCFSVLNPRCVCWVVPCTMVVTHQKAGQVETVLEDYGERFWESLFDDNEAPLRASGQPLSHVTKSATKVKRRGKTQISAAVPNIVPSATPVKVLRQNCSGGGKQNERIHMTCSETRSDMADAVPVYKKELPTQVADEIVLKRQRTQASSSDSQPKNKKVEHCSYPVPTSEPKAGAAGAKPVHPRAASKSERFRQQRSNEPDINVEAKREFNSIVRDIRKLTFSSLGKFEQLKVEAAEIKATGRKSQKLRRMPLPELRLRRAAAERAINKQTMQEKELGVKLYHGKKTLFQAEKEKREELRGKRMRSELGRLTSSSSIGFERGGIVKLKSHIKKKYSI